MNLSMKAFRFGDFAGSLTGIVPDSFNNVRNDSLYILVTIHQNVTIIPEKSILGIGEITAYLHHPIVFRTCSTTGKLHSSRG
jgi:hypothetical protein